MTATAPSRGDERRYRAPAHRKPRRAHVELGLAGLLLAAILLVAQPGLALAGLVAAVVLGVRLLAAAWRMHRRRAAGPERRVREPGRAGPVERGAAIVTTAAVMAVVLAAFSYFGAIGERSNSSFAIRSIEWLRGNGAAWLVSNVEHLYYSASAPTKGGPTLRRLPDMAAAGPGTARRARLPAPSPLAPVVRPALPGEGAWHATQQGLPRSGDSPLLVATYRPDPSYPRVLAAVARVNPRRARLALYPGIHEPPGGESVAAAGEVPAGLRSRLLATFNSGFKFSDYAGGFYAGGRLFQPMRPGLATLVATRSGRLDVIPWRGGSRPGGDVLLARQNLPLIVQNGRPNPHLSGGPEWGTTVGNTTLVWRSGVGIDRRGNLLYAAANYRTVRGLADILIHAGAVRAMELDINSYWVTLNTYRSPGAGSPSKALPEMSRPATRYLQPDDRDFFAVYAR